MGDVLTNLSISYRFPLLSEQYARTVLSTFRTIVRQLTLGGELRLCQLDVVSDYDKQTMLAWNPEDAFVIMQEACMHRLIEAKAQEIPDLEAVCAWDGSLTYLKLNLLANVAAQRLVSLGVGPGVYVPFAYDKSMWAVVATLAILKAGGAFVPLNPRDPPARLAEILRNVNADLVVTEETFVAMFASLVAHVEVISSKTIDQRPINAKPPVSAQPNGINDPLPRAVSFKDPIFVLFTSGSTGKPKGMIHEHAAICTHAMTHGEAMGYHGARVLQFAAHTFDVAIIDFFTTLLYGGCICIPSEEDRRNNIVEVINNMRVDYAILTPSFAGLIEPSEVPTLKNLAIGGEALPQDRIERWADKVRFIQIYGPAEVGICLTKDMLPTTAPEDVGRPLPSCSCWLVDPDDSDRLVPIGAVGEMIIAGPTLARGYLNDEAKTQLSFIDAPGWALRMGLKIERFYKTGDLLKYDVNSFDGSFCFIGRKDAQIKLRGQRVEPGEVEYHLGRLPNVTVSMVSRPEEGCFAGELVAVVQMQRVNGERSRVRDEPLSLAPHQSLFIRAVREDLSKVLPGYMVPTVCLVITSMPFVPSLKIDRRQVSTWLAAMESRPSEGRMTAFARLGSGELTANTLSMNIAKLLAPKDTRRRSVLEGYDFGIQAAGVDSIQLISLSMFFQKHYQRRIPLDVLLSSKNTVRTLADLIDNESTLSLNGYSTANGHSTSMITPSLSTLDFRHVSKVMTEEMFRNIEGRIRDKGKHLGGAIHNVLLTGATGYLGSAILQLLMETSEVHIYALIRCSSEPVGLQHIVTSAISNGWWQDRYISRLHVWQGDLTKASLGLTETELEFLHGSSTPRGFCIHAIIHNGAKVHYSSDYQSLKAVNISSTLELLKMTVIAPHVSRFVFVSGGEKPNTDTSDASAAYLDHLNQSSGYTQTKFVSEQIVHNCIAHTSFHTKRLHIVKPGYIIGSVSDGIANQSDFIWRLAAGCVEIAAYNRDEAAHWLFIADVNRVASSIVSGVLCSDDELQEDSPGHVDRVLDGLPFSEFWKILERVYDQPLEALPEQEWISRLRAKVMESGEAHLLYPLLHVLERDGGCIGEEVPPMPATSGIKQVVEKNVRYLIGVGFLPMPQTSKKRSFGLMTAL